MTEGVNIASSKCFLWSCEPSVPTSLSRSTAVDATALGELALSLLSPTCFFFPKMPQHFIFPLWFPLHPKFLSHSSIIYSESVPIHASPCYHTPPGGPHLCAGPWEQHPKWSCCFHSYPYYYSHSTKVKMTFFKKSTSHLSLKVSSGFSLHLWWHQFLQWFTRIEMIWLSRFLPPHFQPPTCSCTMF